MAKNSPEKTKQEVREYPVYGVQLNHDERNRPKKFLIAEDNKRFWRDERMIGEWSKKTYIASLRKDQIKWKLSMAANDLRPVPDSEPENEILRKRSPRKQSHKKVSPKKKLPKSPKKAASSKRSTIEFSQTKKEKTNPPAKKAKVQTYGKNGKANSGTLLRLPKDFSPIKLTSELKVPSSSKRYPVKSGPPRTPVEKPEATKIASNDTIFASLRKLCRRSSRLKLLTLTLSRIQAGKPNAFDFVV